MVNIKQEFRRILFNYRNKDKGIKMHSDVIFNSNTILEGNNVIYKNSEISDSFIGFGTYISKECRLPNSVIGKYCCIGSNVKIVFGQHPVNKFISVHPAFYSTRLQAGFTYVDIDKFKEHKFADENTQKTIIIGNDVWLGQGVLIMEGVNIADGSVIGAGAIVTKDTEPYSINVGVPAKIIGYRFENQHRQLLESIKWWNKGERWIEENINLFADVDLFSERFIKKSQ